MGPMFAFIIVYLYIILILICLGVKEIREETCNVICLAWKALINNCKKVFYKCNKCIFNNKFVRTNRTYHINNPISDYYKSKNVDDQRDKSIDIEITDYIIL